MSLNDPAPPPPPHFDSPAAVGAYAKRLDLDHVVLIGKKGEQVCLLATEISIADANLLLDHAKATILNQFAQRAPILHG